MPASGPVTRNTLRQQIADALRDEVLAGRLRPGQEFTVKQIADQYGVSATPVREALVDLAAQSLLDSDQHRGFRVREISVADFRSMVEARSLITDGVFRNLAEAGWSGAHADVLLAIGRRADEAARAARAGDLDIFIGYDLRFWRELGALVDNPHISGFLHQLRLRCWVFSVPYLRADPGLRNRLWQDHSQVVDAVTRGDAEAVRAVIGAFHAQMLAWAARLDSGRLERPQQ
ncbi:GntR family transcriptional regulator [Streptomyces agglomeratus]|uniref:GntR family transcriptional regulator n=1 Tax=Streptomyces agglomeratus TaxID=285458 RepID=A0A1E5P8H5_9ACTN|nr:GntR family transcriptional regulator [Streptomyces agglomeratus]OEJ25842.1 GntR family transcriptional regulator [Streptomyces agglomeratus]OEJ52664.1 GntR family transcriptional regulator [Streptomyces agglomeratus]